MRIASDTVEAVVLPRVGARLHSLRAFGHELLRRAPDPATHVRDPFFWGAYVMAPWCNRIDRHGAGFGGRSIELESNFTDGSAIHGQVYARSWAPMPLGWRAAVGGNGWPWDYEVTEAITVADARLRIELALRNLSDAPMPGGIGIHPWFVRPARVRLPADAVYSSNVASGPLPEPVSGRHDLRALGDVPLGLDATWTDLSAEPVEMEWPALDLRAAMRVDSASTHLVLASPPQVDAVAVEPQTHAPQGLRRLIRGEPGPLAVLEPRGSLTLAVEISFSRL